MALTAPYEQKNYMGEFANDAACLADIVARGWDSGAAPINGMWYYNTASHEFRGYINGAWVAFSTGGDEKVKVTANDTTAGYLFDKLIGTSGKITVTEVGDGGDEDLQVSIGADVFDKVVDDLDDIVNGATYSRITGANLSTLTSVGDASSLHHHDGRYHTQTELAANGGSAGSTLIGLDYTSFDGFFSGATDVLQEALDIMDDHHHDGDYYTQTLLNATGGSAGSTLIGTDITNFNNNLSAADNTVQKALDTIDNLSIAPPKAGTKALASFTGTPRKATITFTTTMGSTNYSISVIGGDSRAWSIENKLATSFDINTNSNQVLTADVDWVAVPHYDP